MAVADWTGTNEGHIVIDSSEYRNTHHFIAKIADSDLKSEIIERNRFGLAPVYDLLLFFGSESGNDVPYAAVLQPTAGHTFPSFPAGITTYFLNLTHLGSPLSILYQLKRLNINCEC